MKRILTLTLALMLAFALAAPGLAQTITTESTGTTTVTYGVTGGFSVSIPAGFNLTIAEVTQTVSATNVVIANDKTLVVSMTTANYDADDKFRVRNMDSYIKYTLKTKTGEEDSVELTTNGGTILEVPAGTTSGEVKLLFSTSQANIDLATRAGDHTDTLTFTVALTGGA